MLKNYFKIAWRNIVQKKGYSILNIGGLAIGMACSILILLWVQHELSYDKFHTNADSIYRLTADAGGGFKAAVSPAGMPAGLQNEMPEIKSTVRLSTPYPSLFEVNNFKFEEKLVFYADANFLDFFSFPLIEGNAKTALERPDGMLITEAAARKYFGNEKALGKTIKKDNSDIFMVTGVLANVPSNSHLRFDIILPMTNLAKTDFDLINDAWDNFNFYSYVQLNQSTATSLPKIQEKVNKIYAARVTYMKIDFQLQALTDIHLHSDLQIDLPGHGNIQYVNIFFVIAFIILIVACINFMNLATARSSRRAKEVGLRKVVGARRSQLMMQFLSESLLISFLSLFLAVGLVYLLLPIFNEITDKHFSIYLLDGKLLINLLIIALVTGLLSGSYPALFLSGFKPVKVLKGKIKLANNNLQFRNGLVVAQFFVAVLLMVGTAVIYSQLNFIKNKNLGFDKANLLYIPMTGDLMSKQEALKTALQQQPLTSDFSILSDLPANLTTGNIDLAWEGSDPDNQIVVPSIGVDENFIDVFQMEIVSGRGFSKDFKADSSNYVINEKVVRMMGMDVNTVVGKNISFREREGTIVGVVKDFNFKPLQYAIEPLILRRDMRSGFAVIRTNPHSLETTIEALKKIYGELNPAYPLSYGFLDQDLDNQYRGEQQMGTIFNLFAMLSIFISCIGLYGLSAFSAEQRIKEIGIRKVLGASVLGLVNMLSKDFLKLILIALIIATPVAWYLMNSWLQDFAFHINIKWWMFTMAGLAVLFIALTTIGFQTIKAAIANPIKSLRTE